MAQSLEMREEIFERIYDPEMGQNVPINTAVGKQIIKNYLECLKNGPESENIVSTKMFYKKSSKSKKPATQSGAKGTVRGKCGLCNKSVYSTEERVKLAGTYFHEICYKERN